MSGSKWVDLESLELSPIPTPPSQDTGVDWLPIGTQKSLNDECTCGTWSVYGREVPISGHMAYCDIVRNLYSGD